MSISSKEKFWFLDSLVTIHLAEKASADGLSMIEHRLPYGSATPLHIHHTEEETFHMLAGQVLFSVGSKQIVARAGDTLVAPKGVPHCFIVTSKDGAGMLTITGCGDFERMVRAVARLAENDGLPPAAAPTPEQAEALARICRANGIELIGPPMALTDVSQEVAA